MAPPGPWPPRPLPQSPVSGVIFTLPISPPASPRDSHWTSILGGLQAVTSAVGTGLPPSDHGSLTHTVTSPPTSQPDASILGSRMQSRLGGGGAGGGREALWARALRRTQVGSARHLVFTSGALHVSGSPDGPLLPCPRHASPGLHSTPKAHTCLPKTSTKY